MEYMCEIEGEKGQEGSRKVGESGCECGCHLKVFIDLGNHPTSSAI